MVCFLMSVLQQLWRFEYEEKLAHLRVQKFSGVLLDQQDCLFVYWFLKHLVWNLQMDVSCDKLYFFLFSIIQSQKGIKDSLKGSASRRNLKTPHLSKQVITVLQDIKFANYLRKCLADHNLKSVLNLHHLKKVTNP